MNIGSCALINPFLLAPLAGYTDLPFRLLCREMGASLCCSEMISCHGLAYGQQRTLELLSSLPRERPVAFQLFGADPVIMGEAAARLNDFPADIIDINMGCPVRKVVKKGAGAALMKDMRLAEAIITSVCRNTCRPVTVKFRSGWNHDSIIAAQFGRMAQDAGASAITVHARTWSQGFGGRADWSVIAEVKRAVTIPVVGNGAILTHQDGRRMMRETGCDGVMIGRGALGNPWVFTEKGRPDTLEGRYPVMRRHLELAAAHLPPCQLLVRMKNHLARYLVNLPGATSFRKDVMTCASIQELSTFLGPA
jgi:tRNA-dihydrouridine synthase B